MRKSLIVSCFACLSVFFFGKTLMAQCSHPLTTNFIETQSDVVFEGTVVHRFSDWSEDGRIILTWNEISIKNTLKGNPKKTIFLATKGGIVNDLGCMVTPSLSLKEGDSGVFYAIHLKENFYQATAAQQSFVPQEPKTTFQKSQQKSQQTMNITNLSPSVVAGGIGQIMTVSGSGFGSFVNAAEIQFRNPDVFLPNISYQTVNATHILSWSDSQIQFLVPGRDVYTGNSGAGSGNIRIVHESGTMVQSQQTVVVDYNKINNNGVEIDLINDNESGGYTFTYSTDFSANALAKEAFERALETWNCDAKSNLSVSNATTASNCPAQDNVNSIGFDNGCSLSVGTLAETTNWYAVCGNGVTFFPEIDLLIRNLSSWNYGPAATTFSKRDFETLCLHELGHAHGHGHVLNNNSSLYPALPNGFDLRNLDSGSILCAEAIFEHSTQAINCGPLAPFETLEDCSLQVSQAIPLNIRVFLQGAMSDNPSVTNLMNDDLRAQGYLPYIEPYSNLYGYSNISSDETYVANPFVFNTTGKNAIVDWVAIELRSANNAAQVVKTHIGLLQRDGDVVSVDGVNPVFTQTNENYFVAIRHRNHLGVMTKFVQDFSNDAVTIDFTNPNFDIHGTNACNLWQPNTMVLWGGNTNADNKVIFQGNNEDVSPIFFDIIGNNLNDDLLNNFIISGYQLSDLDMNGQVIYQGPNNDPLLVFSNIVFFPTNTFNNPNFAIIEQLP